MIGRCKPAALIKGMHGRVWSTTVSPAQVAEAEKSQQVVNVMLRAGGLTLRVLGEPSRVSGLPAL